MAGLSRKELGSVSSAIGLGLLVWFLVVSSQDGWDGTGNPMWLALIGASALTAAGAWLIREPKPRQKHRTTN